MENDRKAAGSWTELGAGLAVVLAIVGGVLGLYLGLNVGDGIVWRRLCLPFDVTYDGEHPAILFNFVGVGAGVIAGIAAGVVMGRDIVLLAPTGDVKSRMRGFTAAVAVPVLASIGGWSGAMGAVVVDYFMGGLGGFVLVLLLLGAAVGTCAGLRLGSALRSLLRDA